MIYSLTLLTDILDNALRRLQSGLPERCPVSVNPAAEGVELIALPPGTPAAHHLVIRQDRHLTIPTQLRPGLAGELLLDPSEPERVRLLGYLQHQGKVRPLTLIRLVGEGMHRISWEASSAADPVYWSRTIGGLGKASWERLIALHVGINGLGRTGSRIALSLKEIGVSKYTLVDPDRIEPHNLGETPVLGPAAIGKVKVEAQAAGMTEHQKHPLAIRQVCSSVTHWEAFDKLRDCDFFFNCVDNDPARLAATSITTLFHRPLIDIGTGIHGQINRQMGLDVRLVLPGRCLLCLGGLSDAAQLREVLSSADAEQSFHQARNWTREREGSLASLNMAAVSIALRMFEDLVRGEINHSLWAHAEFRRGQLEVTYPHSPSPGSCRLCQLSGLGLSGVPRFRALLQEGWGA